MTVRNSRVRGQNGMAKIAGDSMVVPCIGLVIMAAITSSFAAVPGITWTDSEDDADAE